MFSSREQAGEVLVGLLGSYKKQKNTLVVGITRGGVVVSKVVAKGLLLPSNILVVKKIGAPTNDELAIGAIGPGGSIYWDRDLIKKLLLSRSDLGLLKVNKEKEQQKKEEELKVPKLDAKGKVILLVDDGVATGATVLASYKYLKKQKAKKIVLVTPVISQDTYQVMKSKFHDIIAAEIHRDFQAVGQFYEDFPQVGDREVIKLLEHRA